MSLTTNTQATIITLPPMVIGHIIIIPVPVTILF